MRTFIISFALFPVLLFAQLEPSVPDSAVKLTPTMLRFFPDSSVYFYRLPYPDLHDNVFREYGIIYDKDTLGIYVLHPQFSYSWYLGDPPSYATYYTPDGKHLYRYDTTSPNNYSSFNVDFSAAPGDTYKVFYHSKSQTVSYFYLADTSLIFKIPISDMSGNLTGDTLKIPHCWEFMMDAYKTDSTHAYYGSDTTIFVPNFGVWHKRSWHSNFVAWPRLIYANINRKIEYGTWWPSDSPKPIVNVAARYDLPNRFYLFPNYPNPFNNSTTIDFVLSKADRVKLSVYNVLGEQIKTLFDSYLPSGPHTVQWDGTDDLGKSATSGLYFIRLQTGQSSKTIKAIYTR